MQCVSTGALDIGREPARRVAALWCRGEDRSAPTRILCCPKELVRHLALWVEHETAASPPVQVRLHLLGLGGDEASTLCVPSSYGFPAVPEAQRRCGVVICCDTFTRSGTVACCRCEDLQRLGQHCGGGVVHIPQVAQRCGG